MLGAANTHLFMTNRKNKKTRRRTDGIKGTWVGAEGLEPPTLRM